MPTLLSVVSGPSVEPVSLQTAKDYVRVDTDQDDAILSALISAARQYVEGETRRAMITTTYDLTLDSLPFSGGLYPFGPSCAGAVLSLPRAPLQEVTSVTYTDPAGTIQTVPSNGYVVRTNGTGAGVIHPAYGRYYFPVITVLPLSCTIRFVAGWSSPDEVPEGLRAAILMMVSHMYNHRDAASDVSLSEAPLGVSALLATWRVEVYA